jgi:hypothetical protein
MIKIVLLLIINDHLAAVFADVGSGGRLAGKSDQRITQIAPDIDLVFSLEVAVLHRFRGPDHGDPTVTVTGFHFFSALGAIHKYTSKNKKAPCLQ